MRPVKEGSIEERPLIGKPTPLPTPPSSWGSRLVATIKNAFKSIPLMTERAMLSVSRVFQDLSQDFSSSSLKGRKAEVQTLALLEKKMVATASAYETLNADLGALKGAQQKAKWSYLETEKRLREGNGDSGTLAEIKAELDAADHALENFYNQHPVSEFTEAETEMVVAARNYNSLKHRLIAAGRITNPDLDK